MLENTFLRRLYNYKNGYSNDRLRVGFGSDNVHPIVKQLSGYLNVTLEQEYYTNITTDVEPSLEDCLAEFPAEWANADRELALYIMLKGQFHNYYGLINETTMEKFADLVVEGVDWSLSSTPNSQRWTEFAGTFAEDICTDTLTVVLIKHDDDNEPGWTYDNEYQFGIEMPSIAEILKASSGFFLSQLEK